jgi:hypothetical protein
MADGRMVQGLADWSSRLPLLTLYDPDRRRVAPKLRAFFEFLRTTSAEPLGGGPESESLTKLSS